MLALVLKRFLQTIPVLIAVSMIVFAVLHLIPGDPVRLMVGDVPISPEVYEQLRHQLGLDQPLIVQYGHFLMNAVTGDLGESITTRRPVVDVIATSLVPTMQLALAAVVFSTIVGIALGTIAAMKAGTVWDLVAMLVSLIGISAPSFWLGLILIYVFSVELGWFPVTSGTSPAGLVLPTISLGLFAVGINARLVRGSLVEVMRSDYIVTAKAKGLTHRTVVIRHGLKNALLPVVTMTGLQLGLFLGGAVVTETVFARPGLGKTLLDAILKKDIPVVQGVFMVMVVFYVVAQLIVDLIYSLLDPRVRIG
ncbi:MAG: ABC transporter permease [Thermomicrobiales bacterium]|nr:ABC transporter permease [Thermomicrobiales bacterium]